MNADLAAALLGVLVMEAGFRLPFLDGAARLGRVSRSALHVLRSRHLSDQRKEAALWLLALHSFKANLQLASSLFILLLGMGVCLLLFVNLGGLEANAYEQPRFIGAAGIASLIWLTLRIVLNRTRGRDDAG